MRRRLQKVLDMQGNAYEISDVAAEIKAGRMQLFQNDHGCVITQVITLPRKKILNIFAVCGEMAVTSLKDDLIAFGKAQGCDILFTEGRKGWARILPRFGWTNLPERSSQKIDLRNI